MVTISQTQKEQACKIQRRHSYVQIYKLKIAKLVKISQTQKEQAFKIQRRHSYKFTNYKLQNW